MSNGPHLDRIALWVAALRDPDAKQATKALTRADGSGDCCLGIACKVAVANGLRLEIGTGTVLIGTAQVAVVSYGGGGGEKAFLPVAVADWLGLDLHDPVIGTHPKVDGVFHGGPITATQANDTLRLTLPQIADIIEAHFLAPAAESVTV